jgi:hypothetical protein
MSMGSIPHFLQENIPTALGTTIGDRGLWLKRANMEIERKRRIFGLKPGIE